MKYKNDIKKIIQDVVNLTVSIENVETDTNLQSVGMDSISFIKVIIEIENLFEIEFPDEKLIITEAVTLKDLCDIVDGILEKRGKQYKVQA